MKKQLLVLAYFLLAAVLLQAKPTVPYEKIDIDTAYASTEFTSNKRFVMNLINGSGLDENGNHSTSAADMWSSIKGGATEHTVLFSLATAERVIGMQLWNSNWPNYTNRGVKDIDIYYATTADNMQSVSFTDARWMRLRSETIEEATGAADYKGVYRDLMSMPSNVRWVGLHILSNHGGDFAYATMSEVELYRSTGVLPATAALLGNADIVEGDSAVLTVNLTGDAPFTFVYTDGVTPKTVTTPNYTTTVTVAPTATTTYTLVSVSDINGAGTVSGSATVTVFPREDAYVAIENSAYAVAYNTINNQLEVTEKLSGEMLAFSPTFYVALNTTKPTLTETNISEDFNYKLINVGGSLDYFSNNVGRFFLLDPISATATNNQLNFVYATQSGFSFSATMTLPTTAADTEPKLSALLTPTTDAYFTIGYYGAPSYGIDQVSEIFQPQPFTEKRFPAQSYLTPAYKATLPATLATINGVTYGVVADASELPFVPLPCTVARSPFGVAIRDKEGAVRPMVWALIMGNADSKIAANTTYEFDYRLYLSKRNLSSAFEDIARRHYGFSDKRHNDLGSLNTAFENMYTFAMGEYGRYTADMKGYSYETDIANSVKNTSSLPIHAISFVVDDSTMFYDRGVPITEFMLSRENFTYAKDYSTGAGQGAYNALGDPCSTPSELLGYYNLGNQQSQAFLELADVNAIASSNLADEKKWRESIARYRTTAAQADLLNVISGADKYISERINTAQTGFNYVNHSKSSFWSSLAPRFWELFETYKITGYDRYLEAARIAARKYAYHLYFCPTIPDEDVLCNIGGRAPTYRSTSPILIDEEYAPAWRLSAWGLSQEAGGTATSRHRGIFMANHAPYFMRIGALTNDQFLMDIAKWAIIGRWRSFPGYHINGDRTTVYEKVDFAHRSIADLITTTSMHYSHVWPMVALVLDYMVSDTYARSEGAIDFPSTFIENTANLLNNLYFKPGVFYGDENVTLWMPKGLITSNNQELNYIVGRGNGKLYIAFTNQSKEAVTATITINPTLLSLPSNSAKAWANNAPAANISVANNQFTVTVSANGITALAIDNADVQTKYQEKAFFQSGKNSWDNAYETLPTIASRAMILGFSNDQTRVYAFNAASKGTYAHVRFQLYFDGVLHTDTTQAVYPFELGQWVPRTVSTVRVVITTSDAKTEEVTFTRNPYQLTASVSGWTSVTQGTTAPITYQTDGKTPWNLTYSNGAETLTSTAYTQTFTQAVAPTQTTTYRLIQATDADGDVATIAQPKAKVAVLDAYVLEHSKPVAQDGYVNQLGANNRYGTASTLQVKGRAGSQQESYLQFDLTNASLNGNRYLLALYLPDSLATQSVLTLSASTQATINETTLTWNTRPDTALFAPADTVGVSAISPNQLFHCFDVTAMVKKATTPTLTFKLTYWQGDENLTLPFCSKEGGEAVAPRLLSDAIFDNGSSVATTHTPEPLTLFVANNTLMVESAEVVQSIALFSIGGQLIKQAQATTQLALPSTLSKGVYLVSVKLATRTITKQLLIA